ncbi:MAG: zinc/manganese transport system substrate-binding protein [Solirubrobacterales bacterium]|jgi:zinc/manganese transport system substrate-binding protein|nr:zinc/manganese transport system substrate-binding protein [Solirubrobacterales bacterium]
MRRASLALLASLALVAALLAGCGGGSSSVGSSGRLDVVAAEDSWGSIAAQLGGDQVNVTSIITNPAADPHDYEPSSEDARTMAVAEVAIVNGIGYDEWAQKLIDANPSSGRTVLDIGDLLGLQAGDNPHQWYSPTSVQRVIARITADYKEADPGHAAYFDRRREAFEAEGLAEYHALISSIKASYSGTPVGASESIFEPLADSLGLELITPTGFIDAISEGTEPSPSDKATADEQLTGNQVKVWVYNSQNATPDVQRLNDEAKAAGIPIATVTETLTPEGASFQEWMARELRGVEAALARAGG